MSAEAGKEIQHLQGEQPNRPRRLHDFERQTPEQKIRRRVEATLNTDVWSTLRYLDIPAQNVEFHEVDSPVVEPEKARIIREVIWESELVDTKNTLQKVNPNSKYVIEQDEETEMPSLFEEKDGEKKRKMWAGQTLSVDTKNCKFDGDKFRVPVFPISYTVMVAAKNRLYGDSFENEGLPLPKGGVGVSVFIVTVDNFVVLTRRGIETPAYPGRLYAPGGGPLPNEQLDTALINEIKEETGLEENVHYYKGNIGAMALVDDNSYLGSKHSRPEIVARLPVAITFDDLVRIQHELTLKNGKEHDVWAVTGFSSFPPNLIQQLTFSGGEMCPPAEAGIAHFLLNSIARQEGMERALTKMDETIRRISAIPRKPFVPPIDRLPLDI